MTQEQFEWLDRREYPFRSNYFPVNRHRLHYIDEGTGNILLFVHGTPSWSFDFRNVIQGLSNKFRCIAIDHIGFGLSDKPEVYDYSTTNHSKTLEKFMLEKDFKNITLVLHDFGGPIGLNVAINNPGRIDKIIIINSWLWSSEKDPEFIKFSKILKNPLLPFLYRRLNFSPRFILPGSFGEKKLSKKLLKQYTQPFKNSKQRNGTLAFAKSLLNDQSWFEKLWNERSAITGKPVLFIWGMKDPIITPKYLSKFESGFPGSTTVKLEASGHFPQEEAPEKVTRAILGFAADLNDQTQNEEIKRTP